MRTPVEAQNLRKGDVIWQFAWAVVSVELDPDHSPTDLLMVNLTLDNLWSGERIERRVPAVMRLQ